MEALIRALGNGDPSVRWQAAQDLGEYREGDAVTALVGALDDEHPFVRWEASASLAQISSPSPRWSPWGRRTVPLQRLIDALKADSPRVRGAAADSLGLLRIDHLPCEDHLHGLASANHTRQPLGSAVPGDISVGEVIHCKTGTITAYPQITGQCEFQALAEGIAGNCSDRGSIACSSNGGEGQVFNQLTLAFKRGTYLTVCSYGECVPSRDNDCPERIISRYLISNIPQFRSNLAVDGVF